MKAWQKVILRNYGTVACSRLATLLHTEEKTVEREAARMGLAALSTEENSLWIKKGFVTIIRNNWDLLSVQDIAALLEMTEKELASLLVEYDFLNIKLGLQQPLEDITYHPLTEEERKNTEEFAREIEENIHRKEVQPFDFFANKVSSAPAPEGKISIGERFISCYCADYSSALTDDELLDYPESYLLQLKATGTNGIWISETLKNLADFPLDRRYAGDYKRRIQNLKKLTERCQKCGINVYLYLNEPRSLPEEFFKQYPHLKGQKTKDGYCLCTSKKETQAYLYEAIKSVAQAAPLLKGIMTITMSENPTHCYSVRWDGKSIQTSCPNCKNRSAEEVAAEVNNVIARALRDGNGYTKLIANLWGWSTFMGWTDEMLYHGIDLLDKDIEVLCVSEYGKDFVRGGVQSKVIDYSISTVGPSEIAKAALSYAKSKGHRIWAKVQMNNSWECSAVPYLPTFGLMVEHVRRLKKLGVDGLMLGWSLGGYPGGALSLINGYCIAGEDFIDEWYAKTYHENSELVKQAVAIFDEAFQFFPFSIDSLYFGGQTLGCGNVWSLSKNNRPSTMVCFTFDDYHVWTKPYGLEKYIQLYDTLTSRWAEGIRALEGVRGNDAFQEFTRYAIVAYAQFKSAQNLAEFTALKGERKKNAEALRERIYAERELTKTLLRLMAKDAKIGYEMTNHYFYNENLLLEKLINLKEIEKCL